MKNSNFKNSFISTLTVTVVGVMLFGVNAALSETPIASPPGGGVGPTFTGLNLTGSVRNETSVADPVTVEDGLNIEGYLAVTGNIHNPGSDIVAIVDDVTISGDISNPANPVTVDDHLVVNNSIDAKDVIKNSGTVNSGKLVIDDSLKVTGDLTTTGNTILGGYLTLGSDQFLTSDKISSSDPLNKPIRFNSPIGVMSDIVSDSIYLSVLSSIKAKGWLITETNVNVQGSILNTKEGTESTWIPAKNAYINTTVGLPVTVDDSLEVTGDLSLNGEVTSDLSVTGKLTAASGVGTFSRESSSTVTVLANSALSYDQYCPSGKVVSCHVKPIETGTGLKNIFALSAYSDSALTYCQAKGFNANTTSRTFRVDAICFDSSL